jgi:hypothetical protein
MIYSGWKIKIIIKIIKINHLKVKVNKKIIKNKINNTNGIIYL